MKRVLVALALLSAVVGCGYRLESGTARFTDPSVRMDVSPFANRSTTPDAGAAVAARFRELYPEGRPGAPVSPRE